MSKWNVGNTLKLQESTRLTVGGEAALHHQTFPQAAQRSTLQELGVPVRSKAKEDLRSGHQAQAQGWRRAVLRKPADSLGPEGGAGAHCPGPWAPTFSALGG